MRDALLSYTNQGSIVNMRHRCTTFFSYNKIKTILVYIMHCVVIFSTIKFLKIMFTIISEIRLNKCTGALYFILSTAIMIFLTIKLKIHVYIPLCAMVSIAPKCILIFMQHRYTIFLNKKIRKCMFALCGAIQCNMCTVGQYYHQ